MFILIDYSNLPSVDKNEKIIDSIDEYCNKISPYIHARNDTWTVRLYGGWYNEDTLSIEAQKLTTIIGENQIIIREDATRDNGHLKLHIELAYSLISNPPKNLFFTYREKAVPHGIICTDPQNSNCSNPNCEAKIINKFFVNKYKYMTDCCNRGMQDLLRRGEQKLVDSMIVSDALYIALELEDEEIVFISSDDDIWPAIETIIACKKSIIHLQPKPGRRIREEYCDGISPRYYIQITT
jgi:uncharacterized LabA/DUF88 family protein